ncbi:class I SAM-dependent methyltransferase [Aeromicrobium sp.]|uniref:class I SAM-dependent methyltransferase n=1 Tax=Aeromicrobium sp. TaxID=1871063 RepID=UPI0019B1B0D0|nr:class I SAM-dependent methyltransferase [Aeromicrobium sp.]MBC7633676.1 class I SAM-dependent methyltransferase [Aeromicrobium sp.]
MNDPLSRLYPETAVGGFSRVDKSIEFFSRIDALVTQDSVVVDFGAGRGGFMDEPDSYLRRLQLFRGRVRKVIGVDIDPVVLENTSVDEAQVWVPGDRIDMPDESVDLVMTDYTFEHVEDPAVVATELGRIVKPGGWICARTPNKWGYIAIGARLVPNRLHARALTRLQPGQRAARDVFPTCYNLNTLRDVRRYFPAPEWSVVGYTVDGEPVYFGRSRVMIYGVYALSRLLPQRFGAMYMFFIQKRATD